MSFICQDERYRTVRLADQSKCGHEVIFVGNTQIDVVQVSELIVKLLWATGCFSSWKVAALQSPEVAVL